MTQQANPVGRPPGRNREQTIKEILLAGRQCFAQRGYDGATIKEVATMVGKTNRAIYQYFDSKEALYAAVLKDTQEAMLPRFVEALQDQGDFKSRLKKILHVFAAAYAESPDVTAFLGSVPIEMNRHPVLQESIIDDDNSILLGMFQLIDAAKASGEIQSTVPTEELFITFVGSAMGMGIMKHGMDAADMDQTTLGLIELIDGTMFKSV